MIDAIAAWEKKGSKYDAETVHGVHVESLEGESARLMKTVDVVKEVEL
jgi:hypothetical protein